MKMAQLVSKFSSPIYVIALVKFLFCDTFIKAFELHLKCNGIFIYAYQCMWSVVCNFSIFYTCCCKVSIDKIYMAHNRYPSYLLQVNDHKWKSRIYYQLIYLQIYPGGLIYRIMSFVTDWLFYLCWTGVFFIYSSLFSNRSDSSI